MRDRGFAQQSQPIRAERKALNRFYAELSMILVVALTAATLATALPVANAAADLLREGVFGHFL
jgi:hypothetical protein